MGTVAKALDLLDCFTQGRPRIGLSDLARLSGTNKATCFRLMSELQARGFVEQDPATREYRLGPAVLRLAALREASVPTREAAMPVLERMAESTGETAHLSLLVAGRLTTLAFVYARMHGVRVMMEDADVLPFHATASGQAVLAFLPDAEREAILARPLDSATPLTLTDAGALRDRLALIRALGWAETASTFETDVHGFAAPLFAPGGACAGAVALAVPAPRVTAAQHGRLAAEVVRAGAEITALWGGQPPEALAAAWAAAA